MRGILKSAAQATARKKTNFHENHKTVWELVYICQVTILSVFRHHFRRHRSTPLFYISKVALGPKKQLEFPTAVLGGHRWTPLFYISKVTLDTTEKLSNFRRFRKTVFEAFWDAPRNHQFYCMKPYISVLWDPSGFRSKPPQGWAMSPKMVSKNTQNRDVANVLFFHTVSWFSWNLVQNLGDPIFENVMYSPQFLMNYWFFNVYNDAL